MKIVFVNPPIREWAKPNIFPLGVGYIAGMLQKQGFDVEVYDINALRPSKEDIELAIQRLQADIIGIGGLITTYRFMKWITPIIKKYHPRTPLVVGGTLGTTIPEMVLAKMPADIVVLGEAEVTMGELARALENKKDLSTVKGIAYKKDGRMVRTPPQPEIADLDTVPFPAWNQFPMHIYFETVVDHKTASKWDDGHKDQECFKNDFKEIAMISSRGCPYFCIYCYHYHLGKNYRFRSAQNLIDEIALLKEKFNIKSVQFLDDCFVINKERVFQFCDLLIKGKFNISWGCNGRVNIVDEKMFQRMKESGCTNVDYGIESGSQKILNVMKKNVSVEQAKAALRLTEKYFGKAGERWNFTMMVGTPGETKETVEESIQFCKSLNMKPDAVFFTTAFPGTDLYRMALERGLIKDEESYIMGLWEMGEQMLLNFTEMPDQELIALKEYMVKEVGAGNVHKHEKVEY